MVKMNAEQLRKYKGKKPKDIQKQDIYIILDNVLDTYNIGAIFRLADAVAAKKIYLCGGTETPPNHRIKKASINTTEVVEWEYCESAVEAIKKVRHLWSCHPERSEGSLDLFQNKSGDSSGPMAHRNDKGLVIAIEQTATAVPYDKFEYKLPLALVVGNETYGISKEVLDMVDAVVELPMFGINKSLNVMVSLGIVLYQVIEKTT